MKKIVVIGVIALFVGVSVSTSIGKIDTSKTNINDGSLLGYVNDTSGNPIEGALVRVHFHETYEEDYSDSTGFYHVTNIPICKCLKNATCSKDGYKTEWVLLGIYENTTHDFILTSDNHPPNAPAIKGKRKIDELGTYDYKFNATDPDGDNVSYDIRWGDGSSEWTDYHASGEEIIVSHTFHRVGYVLLRARAKDIHGVLGPWGELPFTISKVDNNEVKQETSVRIHRASRITPYTLKLTEKESDEVDRIFDNLKVSLDSAETDEEIDEIYNNAVESLYELGLFPKMTVEEAQQLVKGENRNPSVKSHSGNLGTGDENFDCEVIGRTTETFMFDLANKFRNIILELVRDILDVWNWGRFNFYLYNGKIGKISLGSEVNADGDWDINPAKGWVWTNGSNGEIQWDGEFFGNIEKRLVGDNPYHDVYIWVHMGVADFEGLWIGRIFTFNPVFYIGNAEHVSISYNQP